MARTVIVEPGQSLEDIALQEYGNVDGTAWLVFDNLDHCPDGFSTDLEAGVELALRDDIIDRAVYDTARRLGVVPASVNTTPATTGPGGDYNDDYNDDHDNEPI